jgi:hypothetical protein
VQLKSNLHTSDATELKKTFDDSCSRNTSGWAFSSIDQRLSEQTSLRQWDNINVTSSSSFFHSRARLNVTCYCCQEKTITQVIAQSQWTTQIRFTYSQWLHQKKRTSCQDLNADTTKSESKDCAQHYSWRNCCHEGSQALCIFLLNIDAEFNVISQHFTVANEMIKLNAKISHFLLLSNHFIYCYEAYLMKYQLRDSWDQKHNCEHVFYALKRMNLTW